MKCGKARKLIALQVTGDLEYKKAEAVKEHVITCDACAEEAESYRQSLHTLRLLRGRTMPVEYWDGYWEELRGRIHTETTHPHRKFKTARIIAAAAVAAVVLLAVIAAWPWSAGNPSQIPAMNDILVHNHRQSAESYVSDIDYRLAPVVKDDPDLRYASDRWEETNPDVVRVADF